MYYRGAAAAIVVYDITSKDSFAGAKTWVKELQRRGAPDCIIALAGNKSDLEDQRKVDKNEAKNMPKTKLVYIWEHLRKRP